MTKDKQQLLELVEKLENMRCDECSPCLASWADRAAEAIQSLMVENAELKHDLERQMTIANTECNEAVELKVENERLREDAERFRALMRCPRIKMQGSAGVDPKTGERTYLDQPGSVHFGAEFWPIGAADHQTVPTWGHHALRALADDILAVEARTLLGDS